MNTVRENNCTITGNDILGMVYDQNDLIVTADQPIGDPPVEFAHTGGEWAVTVRCGRRGSDGPADWFNENTGASIHRYAPHGGGGGGPHDLNFALSVKLTLDIGAGTVDTRLYLGQGHMPSSNRNNWWFGGNSVLNRRGATPSLLAIQDGEIVRVWELSGGYSSLALVQTPS